MTTFAFIDASNLFYGGEKSLGWKIDYKKLAKYLKDKYGVERAFYFGGVELHNFNYNYINNHSVPLGDLETHVLALIKQKGNKLNEAELLLLSRHLQRIRFYLKLRQFGFEL